MKCEDIIKLLSDYIDREIEESMEKLIKSHIEECERCLSLLRTVEKTISLSRSMLKDKKVPKSVIKRVYFEVKVRYKK